MWTISQAEFSFCRFQAKDGPDADKEAVGMVQRLKDAGKLIAFGTGRQAGLTCSVLMPVLT